MKEQLGEAHEPGARDRLILQTVLDLRLVSGGQLQRLAFSAPDATSHNSRIARRCLERLTAQHLVQRLQRRVGGLHAGSSAWVYAITPSGAAAIGKSVTRGRVREPSLAFLRHHLAVAEAYVQLYEARHQGMLLDLVVQTEPGCWRPLDDGSGGVLKPDLFAVATLAQSERLVFVEVDIGTEHAAALKRKADLYWSHFTSGAEQRTEGVFPEVLWLAPNPHRAGQLAGALHRTGGPQLHRVLAGEELVEYLTKGGEDA